MQRRMRRDDILRGAALPLSPERRKMAEGWLPACVRLSREYERQFRLQPGDLLADAWASCCHAAAKFDPNRGFKFGSYVWPALRRGLLRAAHRQIEEQHEAEWSLMDHDAPTQPEEFDSDGDNLPAWLIVLTEREMAVVRMRSEGMTLHQCGLELGLSASRIGYMLKDIQVKVRKLM